MTPLPPLIRKEFNQRKALDLLGETNVGGRTKLVSASRLQANTQAQVQEKVHVRKR